MERPKTKDMARGLWKSILPALGIDARFLTGKHGPCPMCEGRDRWRFDDKGGEGTWFCSNCGAGDGIKLVMAQQRLDFRGAAQRIEEALGVAPLPKPKADRNDPAADKAKMNAVWKLGRRVDLNTVAGRYLAARTGLTVFAPDLRAVASLDHFVSGERFPTSHPALIALVRDADGAPVNVHRTYLHPDGGKANVEPPRKAMQGGVVGHGAAIRLAAYEHVLGIAEGVETALSASVLHGIPCWAAVSAVGLEQWTPPDEIKIVIFGDNDDSFTGHKASYALAFRLARERFDVEVRIPDGRGEDWNDLLRRQLARNPELVA